MTTTASRPVQVDPRDPTSPRILLTNDDGIDAPGLRAIAGALAEEHDDVLVAAPADDMSGSGTGIGRYDPEHPTALARRDFDGVEAYAVEGPPGLAVMSAALGAFGPRPRLVVSGVNAGMNTGQSIIHSGTVGAALTAHTFGGSGVALSLAESEPWQWDTVAPITCAVVRWMLRQPPRTALNVNIPALPLDEVRGGRWAGMDEFGHFRVATADVPGGTLELSVSDRRAGAVPDSDTALCLSGHVTLTRLSPMAPAAPEGDPDVIAGLGRPTR